MTATALGEMLAASPDLIAEVAAWRERECHRSLRVETAAAALGRSVLEVLDAVDHVHALTGSASLVLTPLRTACCQLAATASETLAVVVEAREQRRPQIAAHNLPNFLGREEGLIVEAFLQACASGSLALDAYGRMLRDRTKRVLRGLRNLAEGADPVYDASQTRERDVIEVIALALALPVALNDPGLTPRVSMRGARPVGAPLELWRSPSSVAP